MTNLEIINKLKAASDGLLFMSGSEYPLEVFFMENECTSLTRKSFTTNRTLPRHAYKSCGG
ncbi:nuclease A inhibitor family protein [Scytonema sp. PCC 10023]|uniref:nuclease A inhibitor family protein n=1 Tax=Scytonema sp. PCC 10023 TaxID=1680591 RepID=UPI0039C6C075